MSSRVPAKTEKGSYMDALMLRFLQGYIRDTFGSGVWQAVCRRSDLTVETFEPMLRYDPGTADLVAGHAAAVLGRSVDAIWEDMGTHLVTSPGHEGVRRLLRFGGIGFGDFLHSLVELPGRARLALPELDLPELHLDEVSPDAFELRCTSHLHGTLRVLSGLLTAMADEYGTLCLIETPKADRISVRILDNAHAKARRFDLAMPER
jgi:Haem-NO-binding